MDARAALATFLKGAAMGTADMVPGVSGGTIAMVVGIYDRLVGAIAAVHPRPLADLPRLRDPAARRRLRDAWIDMDVTFLLVLGTGLLSAVVVLSQVIPVALEELPGLTGSFFVGLIAASVVLIGRTVPWTLRKALLAVGAAALAVAVATVSASVADPSLLFVFVAGVVAISAMVLPGLSGALILLILGQYDYLVGRLDAFLGALVGVATGGSTSALVGPGAVVGAFVSGAIVGLLTFGRVVDWALERDRATTIAGLVGLMAGGVYPPAELAVVNTAATPTAVAAPVALCVLGAAVVTAFDWATGSLEYVDESDADAAFDAVPTDEATAGE